MITSSNHAGASARFARIAAYVGRLFEDETKADAIELHHFECPHLASRGLNRPYELGELCPESSSPDAGSDQQKCAGSQTGHLGNLRHDRVGKVLTVTGYRKGGDDGRFRDCRSGLFGRLRSVSGWLHLRSVGGATMTQSEKYEQYAREAQEQVSHGSNDADKAAWLWIAQSWLNLLGQNEPGAGGSGSDGNPVKAG